MIVPSITQKKDYSYHIQGGCITKGCSILRHRKRCKYFDSEVGCHRGERLEYLHIDKELNLYKDIYSATKNIQIGKKYDAKDKEIKRNRKIPVCVNRNVKLVRLR